MSETTLAGRTASAASRRAQQEAVLAQLIEELQLSGTRIEASLDRINHLIEMTVEEMRAARIRDIPENPW